MNEQTNPEPGVSQGDGSIESAVSRLVQSEDQALKDRRAQEGVTEPPQGDSAEQAQGQADEPSADDLEVGDSVEQPAIDAFEIVHNGQQVKLSREDTIKYAQQGFDATRKLQAAAEQSRQAASQLQRLAQIEQVHPQLLQQRAQVEAIRSQIEQYRNFNWVKLAQEDPLGYPAQRAQFDVLVQAFNDSSAQYQHNEGIYKKEMARVMNERLQAEHARIPELIPEWTDKAKREAGEAQLAKHYQDQYGIPFEELNGYLTGAVPLAVAYKAMKYDQLVRSKTDKAKQLRTVPPVTVPGAVNSGSAKADQDKALRAKLRKSGSMDDAVALLLNRGK